MYKILRHEGFYNAELCFFIEDAHVLFEVLGDFLAIHVGCACVIYLAGGTAGFTGSFLGVPFLGVALLGVVSLLLTVEALIVLHQVGFLGICEVTGASSIDIHGISSLGGGAALSIGRLSYPEGFVKPLASLILLLVELLCHLPFDMLFMSCHGQTTVSEQVNQSIDHSRIQRSRDDLKDASKHLSWLEDDRSFC